MQHPVQALATVGTLVITATNSTLTCFDLSTNTQTGTSNPHSALIRSLATFTDKTSSNSYIVSTGEDKQLVVSSLPSLEQLSKRELLKRANALDVTEQGEIIVGDKFGDVYLFPLLLPATVESLPTTRSDPKSKDKKAALPEHLPILGHVSMLNTLALIPTKGKQYIATGDRDEHVRISRFPLGHIIEGFLWGSKNFVSSLLYLPPLSDSSPPMLLSAGGDPTIQVYSLTLPSIAPTSSTPTSSPVGDLVTQFPIESLLLEHIVVAPVLPDPVPAGRKKDKKGKGKSSGPSTAEGTPEVEVVEKEEGGEEVEEEKKELKLGLAVIKMVEVGATREEGGIVVLAAGSTALLYIPFSSLLPSSSTPAQPPSLLKFPHPILDFVPLPIPSSSTSSLEFLLTLDTTRPTPSTSSSSFARVSLTSHVLSLLPTESTSLFTPSSLITTSTRPSISSLYPTLMMLHHPGDDSDLIEPSTNPHNAPVETAAGNGKPKGGLRNLKRPATELGGESGGGPGKRAVGRAETLRRWEEAKRKLEEKKELSEGEKEAVEAVEKGEMQLEEEKKE